MRVALVNDDARSCPSCGLVIKVTGDVVDTCPVCGTRLPITDAHRARTLARIEATKPVSLENVLFQHKGTRETWTLKETVNVLFLTWMVTVMLRFFILAAFMPASSDGEPAVSPLLVVLLYLASTASGIVPMVYIKVTSMSYRKLGVARASRRGAVGGILAGLIAGVVLHSLDVASSIMNGWIHELSGWEAFGVTAGQQTLLAFTSEGPWNKLVIIAPYGASMVLGTFLHVGVILHGLLQHHEQQSRAGHAKAVILAAAVTALFSFSLSFNPATVFFAFTSALVLAVVFYRSRDILPCLVANLVIVLVTWVALG